MDFSKEIEAMNRMYDLPVSHTPTTLVGEPVVVRLEKYLETFEDEVNEGWDIVGKLHDKEHKERVDFLTDLADWFGDKVVYIFSEAQKFGIPMWEVLEIIMESNKSKLGPNGEVLKDANGKFLKGPNYWKPEPKIRELLERKMNEKSSV